jgi:hypothetical protein
MKLLLLAVACVQLAAGAVASAADTPIVLTLQPELDTCQCAGHRPASLAAQVPGSTALDALLPPGRRSRPSCARTIARRLR